MNNSLPNLKRSLFILDQYTWTIYVTFGFLLFSTSGEILAREWIGLSYNIQEIWLIAFLPLLARKHIIHNIIRIVFSKTFLFLISIMLILLSIPIFRGFPVYEIVRSARPSFYMVILASYFSRYPDSLSITSLYWLCIGAMMGDIYATVTSLNDATTLVWGKDLFVHGMNVTAIFLALVSAILKRRTLLIVIAYLISGVVILLSSFRINLAALLSATVVSTSLLFIKMKDSYAKRLFFIKAIFVTCLGIPVLYRIVLDNSSEFSFVLYRFFERTSLLLKGDFSQSEDDIRLTAAANYMNSLDLGNFIPNGFISVAKGLMSFHYDFPLAYFFDIYGIGIASIILFFFVMLFIVSLYGLRKSEKLDILAVARLYLLFLFPLLVLVNGRFLYVVSESILFGIVLGISLSAPVTWLYSPSRRKSSHLLSNPPIV